MNFKVGDRVCVRRTKARGTIASIQLSKLNPDRAFVDIQLDSGAKCSVPDHAIEHELVSPQIAYFKLASVEYEFKVGDRVRVTRTFSPSFRCYISQVGIITKLEDATLGIKYLVTMPDNRELIFYEENLELVGSPSSYFKLAQTKFKVGDIVRVLPTVADFLQHIVGREGTIVRILEREGPFSYQVKLDPEQDIPFTFYETSLELVDPSTAYFKQSDLDFEIGDKIEFGFGSCDTQAEVIGRFRFYGRDPYLLVRVLSKPKDNIFKVYGETAYYISGLFPEVSKEDFDTYRVLAIREAEGFMIRKIDPSTAYFKQSVLDLNIGDTIAFGFYSYDSRGKIIGKYNWNNRDYFLTRILSRPENNYFRLFWEPAEYVLEQFPEVTREDLDEFRVIGLYDASGLLVKKLTGYVRDRVPIEYYDETPISELKPGDIISYETKDGYVTKDCEIVTIVPNPRNRLYPDTETYGLRVKVDGRIIEPIVFVSSSFTYRVNNIHESTQYFKFAKLKLGDRYEKGEIINIEEPEDDTVKGQHITVRLADDREVKYYVPEEIKKSHYFTAEKIGYVLAEKFVCQTYITQS